MIIISKVYNSYNNIHAQHTVVQLSHKVRAWYKNWIKLLMRYADLG